MKTLVLLSGSGVYDGSEIHESVFALLSLNKKNLDFICCAPNTKQHHVVNHQNGEELIEERSILIESARIARGNIISLDDVKFEDISSLVIPGGFGVAKNLSSWAFDGYNCKILKEVRDLILHCVSHQKPIVSLCISPVIIAKSLEGSDFKPVISLGSNCSSSDYDIDEIHNAVSNLGAKTKNRKINQVCIDENLRIISAPCYMMNGEIKDIFSNIDQAIDKLCDFLNL